MRAHVGSLYALTATSAIAGCAAVAAAAAALTPPAVAIADRYLTLTAILVGATVVTTVATRHRTLDRPGRLAAVVVVLAAGGAWHAARLWVHEKQFDFLVGAQQRQLELSALELAGDIENFVRQRAAQAPRRPAPETWDRDVAAMLAFDNETAALFAAQFGPQVRRTRNLLVLEGLTDRDFDAFYRSPANAFQIDIVARRLDALARRLHRLERHPA
ncbi:MAG TPA: hypothetical protein VKE51_17850, partial [Vicinamibacterales bacterium]|nr:hypothetical protein [Vicinamibacterales bacterium]